MNVIQLAWERFSILARIFGDMQARVIATLMYYTIILPFGLIMRAGDNPFHQRAGDRTAASWIKREPVDNSLEGASRQG
jgi:cytochrome b subunit of formate dehydrogenase